MRAPRPVATPPLRADERRGQRRTTCIRSGGFTASADPIIVLALVGVICLFVFAAFAVDRPALQRTLWPLAILFPLLWLMLLGVAVAASGVGDASMSTRAGWGLYVLAASTILGAVGFALACEGNSS